MQQMHYNCTACSWQVRFDRLKACLAEHSEGGWLVAHKYCFWLKCKCHSAFWQHEQHLGCRSPGQLELRHKLVPNQAQDALLEMLSLARILQKLYNHGFL